MGDQARLNGAELRDFDRLWNYEDPAATEVRFRELLPAAESDPDSTIRLELLTQIARTFSLRRQFDDAHALLDEVDAARTPEMRRLAIRYLLERGRAFNSSGSSDKAKPFFDEAYKIALEAGEDTLAVDAAHMIAIVVPTDEQIEWNERTLELAERSSEPKAKKWRASLYNNLGWTVHDLGQYAKALEIFERALELREEAGDPITTRIARWTVARALRSIGRVEEALGMQRAQYADAQANDRVDPYNLEELGECLFALGNLEDAIPYFARAYTELSADPWLAKNEPERLERLESLSK